MIIATNDRHQKITTTLTATVFFPEISDNHELQTISEKMKNVRAFKGRSSCDETDSLVNWQFESVPIMVDGIDSMANIEIANAPALTLPLILFSRN